MTKSLYLFCTREAEFGVPRVNRRLADVILRCRGVDRSAARFAQDLRYFAFRMHDGFQFIARRWTLEELGSLTVHVTVRVRIEPARELPRRCGMRQKILLPRRT